MVTTHRGHEYISRDEILRELVQASNTSWFVGVKSNPDLPDIEDTLQQLSDGTYDAIIAFGGGSAIDTAKVLSVFLGGEFKSANLRELLERGGGLVAIAERIPVYAVPTTSGTGSEVTPFATVWDHERRKKYSLSSDSIVPYVALVDPELVDRLPEDQTLFGGLDAMCQAAEAIWNKRANPLTTCVAARALQRAFTALPALLGGSGGAQARDLMAECSLFAGLAISHTRTALCHSISYPITTHFGVPHGLACAFTMPTVLKYNSKVDDGRLAQLAKEIIGPGAACADLEVLLAQLLEKMEVRQRVASYIENYQDLQALAGEMLSPGRADNNMREVDESTVREILFHSWHGSC